MCAIFKKKYMRFFQFREKRGLRPPMEEIRWTLEVERYSLRSKIGLHLRGPESCPHLIVLTVL